MSAPPRTDHTSSSTSYYRVTEAAEKIRIGVRALRDGVNHHGWPHSRPGGRVLIFNDADLATIYELHRVASRPTRRSRRV